MLEMVVSCSGPHQEALSFFFQRGILVPVAPRTPLTEFLLCTLNIPEDYLVERVQTIFLDGRPVDRPESATLGPRSSVALSASLPGLVGATLRKAGAFSCLRSSISYRETGGGAGGEEPGYATFKLFNLLIGELGTILLGNGVLVSAETAAEALGQGGVLGECERIEVDGAPVRHMELGERLIGQGIVRLRMAETTNTR
jgi:hypothetical protein